MKPNNMVNKKALMVVLVICIISCACILLASVVNLPNSNSPVTPTPTPISSPVSFPGDVNVITIGKGNKDSFNYAVINKNGTIELKNDSNKNLIIQLSDKKWKDIKFNPDNTLVSVLGESKTGIYDLYIYNLKTKNWLTATNYTTQPVGIDSYIWVGNKTIFFTQGQSLDNSRWLHKFNYESVTDITKLARVEGSIQEQSPNTAFILITQGNSYEIYNQSGEKVSSFNTALYQGKNITIKKLIFSQDPNKLIFLSSDNFLYKEDFGSLVAFSIGEENGGVKLDDLNCSLTENAILGYALGDTLNIVSINTQTGVQNIMASEPLETKIDKIKCFKNNPTLIKIGVSWYFAENQKLVKLALAEETTDITYIN